MTFQEQLTQFVCSTSNVALVVAMLAVGAAYAMGIGFSNPEHFFDFRNWAEAVNNCLRSL
jgi:hypothetical protein